MPYTKHSDGTLEQTIIKTQVIYVYAWGTTGHYYADIGFGNWEIPFVDTPTHISDTVTFNSNYGQGGWMSNGGILTTTSAGTGRFITFDAGMNPLAITATFTRTAKGRWK